MRFLFVTWGGGGNVPPTLAIARRLIDRGHLVHVLGTPALQNAVKAAGCAFVPYRRVIDGIPLAAGTAGFGRLRAGLLVPELARSAPSLAFAQDLLAQVSRTPADALVIDFMLAGAIAAGERAGLPTAALMHTVYCLPAPGAPPFGPAWSHRSSARRYALHDAAMSTLARAVSRQRLGELNAARRALGLDSVLSASQQLAGVARVLVLTSNAFDPPLRELPPNVRYVGPQLDNSPRREDVAQSWPDDDPRPLVVVSFSTRFAAPRVVQRVLDALAALSVRTVLTLGRALSTHELRVPAGVTARSFLPHAALLPQTRLVVTHAGLGTVMASLGHGVPLLCMPLKNDQFETAARVVAAGAGLRLSWRASRRSVRHAALELLREPRYTARARRLADAIAADGPDRAVDELETLVRPARPLVSGAA